MTGITGSLAAYDGKRVARMLGKLAHRGRGKTEVFEYGNATFGIANKDLNDEFSRYIYKQKCIADDTGYGHFAEARITGNGIELYRDELGVAPLYYGYDKDGILLFASEMKALNGEVMELKELQPGCRLENGIEESCYHLEIKTPVNESPENIAKELRSRLEQAADACTQCETMGSWLSGGLDSSIITALARPRVRTLHTFSAGFKEAPDLHFARAVSGYLKTTHHEVIVDLEMMLRALSETVYHLESFDALLVRSSITNYLVAKSAADYAPEVFSGEAADEFFAGYEYLKGIPSENLDGELLQIIKALHNTAFQRVDRSASAHGLKVHVIFADPHVFEYALSIPSSLKLHDGIEKWILRRAMEGTLPDDILYRRKAKFWEGAGTGDILSDHASATITDHDFSKERILANGWVLNTKEELMYYRIFKEHFGEMEHLGWMGRTKGSPIS